MQIWYASYGSNLARDRFLCYVRGGRPAGASRTYPGARDTTPPADDRALTLPGEMFFAWESPTWGGGIAFYDPTASGRTLARAYLLTDGQFADVAAQEMHREPGEDLDLTTVLDESRHDLGPGRYESLHLVGELEGRPVLTFTAPDSAGLQRNAPTRGYVEMIARGLSDTHGLGVDEITAYVAERPGASLGWDADSLLPVVSAALR
ncbi:histone deacetylase [Pedococcus sp. KACC 23699]|uniref:Histone deacetylase n=1 Tax=Pedococcus sp. KACC 23699 TaxID=3149228 RepID=A0AAU7JRD7_9MICO